MTDQDMLRAIYDNVTHLVNKEGAHAAEIRQLKEDIKPIRGLVAWKNRWGGAVIAFSFMGSVLGFIAMFVR